MSESAPASANDNPPPVKYPLRLVRHPDGRLEWVDELPDKPSANDRKEGDAPCPIQETELQSIRQCRIAAGVTVKELEQKLAAAEAELRNISTADIATWDEGYRTPLDFMRWAQNRARTTLAEIDSAAQAKEGRA